MNYKEFAGSIAELLRKKMGDGFTVEVTDVLKNNDISLTGVIIMEKPKRVSPTIYLEEPYRKYQDGTAIEKIVEEIVSVYGKHACNIDLDVDFFQDFSRVEERIFHKVINYEKNRKLLQDMPYFRWHDLAVIFYYALEEPAFGKASILIHNNHLKMWGETAENIYCIARHNMVQKMPELLVPLQKMLEEMAGITVEENVPPLYVLTNREKMFGASAMLYSEKMKKLADELHTDLLILPSSTHEVLLLPDDQARGYDFYKEMVREVNTTQVDPEEILSFNLYRYDRGKGEIEEIAV